MHHSIADSSAQEIGSTRRKFLYGSVAVLGAMTLFNNLTTQVKKGGKKMLDSKRTALMICDYQLGIGDQPYAKESAQRAAVALDAGRKAGMLVIFSKVTFRPGYTDISSNNKAFAIMKAKNILPPGASHLIPSFQPLSTEIVVDKDRFSAFSGNDLHVILRSQGITHLVMAGVTTSGVVLSTFCEAADKDFAITILSDACADPVPSLNYVLMTDLFPRSASVLTVSAWAAGLTV